MRTYLAAIFAAVVSAALALPACGADYGKLSGKKLVVGTMARSLGLPVRQAEKAGYFKDAGLTVETVIFATGAPINEAMAAEELDVAVSGMASIYALATNRYTYIGDGCITIEGQAVYARPDSPVTKHKGVAEGTLGSVDTVRGAAILGPLATSAHYLAIKYVESFGLTADDFDMVSMEYPQAYQAFVTGQGDLIATVPPFSNQLDERGYTRVCDLWEVTGSPLVDTIFVQNDVRKERENDLLAFLDCYYRASADLRNDKDLRRKVAKEWYAEEGITYSDEDMDTEIRQQTYHTLDTMLTPEYPFGLSMTGIGAFFVTQGMIDEDNAPFIASSLDKSLVERVKAANGK